MRGMIENGIDTVLSFLYPPKCVFCGELITRRDVYICDKCCGNLQFVPNFEVRRDIKYCNACFSALYYEGAVKDSLIRYKFTGKASYFRTYANLLHEVVEKQGIRPEVITWVPLSRKRKKKRGYDQSRLIAERLSKLYGIKCEMLLKKKIDNPPQSRTANSDIRLNNVKGVYSVITPEKCTNRCVLIIDDIVTTGATLSECSKVIKAAGASEVYAATVAKTKS